MLHENLMFQGNDNKLNHPRINPQAATHNHFCRWLFLPNAKLLCAQTIESFLCGFPFGQNQSPYPSFQRQKWHSRKSRKRFVGNRFLFGKKRGALQSCTMRWQQIRREYIPVSCSCFSFGVKKSIAKVVNFCDTFSFWLEKTAFALDENQK